MKTVLCRTVVGAAAVALLSLGSAPAFASDYPLDNVLPASAAGKLAKVGIKTTNELLNQGANSRKRRALAKKTGIKTRHLTLWVQMSDLLRINGVGPIMAKLLKAARVDTVAQLRRQKAERLLKRVTQVNKKSKITPNPPSKEHLAGWIASAKKLKIVVR